MSDKRVQITVQAKGEGGDELKALARELDAIAQSGSQAAPEAAALAEQLRGLARQDAAIQQFANLKRQAGEMSGALDTTRERATNLGRALAESEKPTAAQRHEFDAARKAAGALEARYQTTQRQLNALRGELADGGISTQSLAAAQRKLSKDLADTAQAARAFPAELAARQAAATEAAARQAEQEKALARATAAAAQELAEKDRQAQQAAEALAASQREAAAAQAQQRREALEAGQQIGRLRNEYEKARAETQRLGAELARTHAPTAAQRREFEGAARSAMQLEQRLRAQQPALAGLRNQLAGTGAAEQQLTQIQLQVVRSLDQSSTAAIGWRNTLDQVGAASRHATAAAREQAAAHEQAGHKLNATALAVRGGLAALSAAAGALTVEAGFHTMLSMDSLRLTLETVAGSSQKAATELKYVREVCERLGLDVDSAGKAWARFMSATKGSALEGQKARDVFEAISSSMARMGKGSEDVQEALVALEQMVSKGTIQSEELKEQLGSRLPGAFQLTARAISVTDSELTKLLETGSLTAEQVLPRLAVELNKTFGDSKQRVESLGSAWQRLKNSLFSSAGETGNGLLGGVLAAGMDKLSGAIEQSNGKITEARRRWTDFRDALQSGDVQGQVSAFSQLSQAAASLLRELSPVKPALDLIFQSAEQKTEAAARASHDAAVEAANLARAKIQEAEAARQAAQAAGDEAGAKAAANRAAAATQELERASAAEKARALDLARTELASIEKLNASRRVLSAQDYQQLTAARSKLAALEAEAHGQAQVQAANALTGQSLQRLQLDYQNAKKAADEASSTSIRSAKARLDEAKATLEVAQANEDSKGARAATVAVAQAELALQQAQLQAKSSELEMAQRELALIEQQNAAKTKLSDTDRQREVAARQGITALEDEVQALKNATRAADAHAAAVKKNADDTLAAYRTLGITSQAELKKAANEAEKAFHQVEQAAGKGLATQKDVKAAFLAYSEKALASGDLITRAMLKSRAEVLGVAQEFAKLAEQAEHAGNVGAASMDKMAQAARNAGKEAQTAGENMADGANQAQEKTVSYVSLMAVELQRLAQETSSATAQMANANYLQAMKGVRSIDQWWRAIDQSLRSAKSAYIEQQQVLEANIAGYQQMAVTAETAEINTSHLRRQFNLLNDADLGRLQSEVERVNGAIRTMKEEAAQAQQQLEQMAAAAQDELDRSAGNTAAIEQRKLQQDLARVEELAQKSGNNAAAQAARAAVELAARQRISEAQQRDAQARQPTASGDAAPSPAALGPSKTVRVELALPGGPSQSVEVASDGDAEQLVRALESLKRRGA
ncbi:hypothetical protein BUE93_09510 [Chromobacterium amazonense]|uniref:Tape measure protein N-terminal domain-containing protein n=1 Tax=Chromobacterium amazonense TaxID=1382803 RepID=A0A2S9X5C1_9NEIS|nr:tape measure protein [Chromobacterium amazonense]PRP70887.1 hypothetical protein BUE93_09510 [Chromobacterium amazonense]